MSHSNGISIHHWHSDMCQKDPVMLTWDSVPLPPLSSHMWMGEGGSRVVACIYIYTYYGAGLGLGLRGAIGHGGQGWFESGVGTTKGVCVGGCSLIRVTPPPPPPIWPTHSAGQWEREGGRERIPCEVRLHHQHQMIQYNIIYYK